MWLAAAVWLYVLEMVVCDYDLESALMALFIERWKAGVITVGVA